MDVRLDCARREVLGAGSEGPDLIPEAEYSDHHRRMVVPAAALGRSSSKPFFVSWAESFIFAGSSALLLLIANLFPAYWYFSFFALTPFLYRIINAEPSESLRLGFLFGLSFFAVSEFEPIDFVGAIHVEHPAIGGESPLGGAIHELPLLIFGTGLFSLFGWALGWARKQWGFYPSIVALLWVGLEIGLVKLGFVRGLLGETEISNPFFNALATLFGFLTVSAIIVILNSLIVLVIFKTLAIKIPRGKKVQEDERTWDLLSTPGFLAQKVYLIPEGRAPPFVVTGVSSFSLTNGLWNIML